MIGVQVKLEGNSKEILAQLAEKLNTSVENDRIQMPSFVGDGYCKSFHFGKGVSAILSNCCYKIDIEFGGMQSHHPVFVLQYDYITKCKEQQEEEEPVNENQPGHTELAFAFGNVDHKQPRSRGKKVLSLRILLEKAWFENVMEGADVEKDVFGLLDTLPSKQLRMPLSAEEKLWLTRIFDYSAETSWNQFYTETRIRMLLEKFVMRLQSVLNRTQQKHFSDHEMEQLKLAEQTLVADFSEPAPTITHLSKMVGMSPSKFKTDFRELFGLPVYQYYQKSRMLFAKELIEKNIQSIKEVGIRVGYTNLSHFSSAFRKEIGVLPKQLLETAREKRFQQHLAERSN